ncbi:PKD domain-containing protein [Reichenbachiella sp.]|uniref:PKD domain-containing protein n=1 Tax=Reichenbachiella sp. TaxID=2184521 RepID=UPI003B5B0682
MTKNIKTSKFIKVMNLLAGFSLIVSTVFFTACEKDTLPAAGSIADTTPPKAAFSYSSDPEDQKKIVFTNQSESATDFSWEFGDGNTSDEENPSNTYGAFGNYDVTIYAMDKLGVESDTTITISVVEGPYQPVLKESGFEGDGETGDGRDPWRSKSWTESGNSWPDENSVFGISGSPVSFGNQAAKLESQPDNPRQGYQEFVVEADQNYDLSFWYTMKDDSSDPWAIVAIVGVTENGPISSAVEAKAGIIASVTINDTSDPETYVQQRLAFNSGDNTTVAIYFYNDGNVETRLDEFSIDIAPDGAIPPSVSFSMEQSDVNYLSYTFTNTSVDATSYEWDFGDGNMSTEASPTHVYAEAGNYEVSLTGKNDAGLSADFSITFDLHAPTTSAFSYAEGADIFTIDFTDESVTAASVVWDFGDGFQYSTTDANATVTHIYSGGPGFYTVKLTAISSTGFESEKTETLAIGVPKVLGGDFENTDTGDDRDYWRVNSYGGGEISGTTPYSDSADGAFETYDGTDTDSKTRGAKIDGSKCANADGSTPDTDTRYSYQEMDLSPGVEYYLEFSYNNADGTVVAGEILDGHFADGSDAYAASLDGSSLVEIQGTVSNGETSGGSDSPQWRTIRGKFTAPGSGEVSIWMWAHGGKSFYDNIKILPASIVEAN